MYPGPQCQRYQIAKGRKFHSDAAHTNKLVSRWPRHRGVPRTPSCMNGNESLFKHRNHPTTLMFSFFFLSKNSFTRTICHLCTTKKPNLLSPWSNHLWGDSLQTTGLAIPWNHSWARGSEYYVICQNGWWRKLVLQGSLWCSPLLSLPPILETMSPHLANLD